jgi:hypothetical protein
MHPVTFAQAAPELRSIKKNSTLLSPGEGSTLVPQNPDSVLTKLVKLSACVTVGVTIYLVRYISREMFRIDSYSLF